ncbi:MAG TPA: AAA family ATPase [Dermatophilaceae bacterium]|nr:AAA family ATPase [Dermatophilaceae bacterium]
MNMERAVATLEIPAVCMVLLVGASGAGKSTFARQHFGTYEVVSSDTCRAIIVDDPSDQSITPKAFRLARYIARLRLAAGRLVVIDATNVQSSSRARMLGVAATHHVPAIAVVFDLPATDCIAQNRTRLDRHVTEEVILAQVRDLCESLPLISGEGFQEVVVLRSGEEAAELTVSRS